MSNDKIHGYYTNLAKQITTPEATRNKSPDFSEYDIAFVKKMADPDKSLLDLGAGSGLLLNEIVNDFSDIVAVELYEQFTQFIKPRPNLTIVNEDIRHFSTSQQFDIVIAFGVLNFFDVSEASHIYSQCFKFAKPGGVLVIKHQMGLNDNVIVDGFSEELQQTYYSQYRHSAHEAKLIKACGFESLSVYDIYPDEFNRWENTRFKAIVARKP